MLDMFEFDFEDTDSHSPSEPTQDSVEALAFYDAKSLETALAQSARQSGDDEKERRRMLERLLLDESKKPRADLPSLATLEAQAKIHPNFSEVIDYIAQQVALCRRQKSPGLRLAPILLEGPPGIGKSHFARIISNALGSTYCSIDFATLTSGFALSGLHRSWSSGQMGLMARTLWDSPNMSPIFFLDELDKPNSEAKSAPLGPLYALLERHTAQRFRDEYLEIDFDLSHAVWFAAVNDATNIPLPLLSRFTRFCIEAPSDAQLQEIVIGHYHHRRTDLMGFPECVPPHWLQQLQGSSVREAISSLDQAMGRAAQRADRLKQSQVMLWDQDLCSSTGAYKRIGFV